MSYGNKRYTPAGKYLGVEQVAIAQTLIASMLSGVTGPGSVAGSTVTATLSQVERRCAICHKLAHIDLGHQCGDDPMLELAASKRAARQLIRISDLESAVRWTEHLAEQADILWVTETVLQVRLDHLHPAERGLLHRAVEHHRESEQQWDRYFNDEMGIA